MKNSLLCKRILLLLILVLFAACIYSNTLNNPFVYDDLPFVYYNKHIKDLTDVKAIWKASIIPSRFVSFLSFAVSYHFHKLDVFGYHLTNIIIHLMNGLLVFWLMLLTFQTPKMRKFEEAYDPTLVSFFVALLFLVHPIQTQAVTYITQRFASLATFFYLASLCCFVQGRLSKRVVFFILSGIGAVLGMFTKEIVVTLPVMILLYDYCFFKRKAKQFPWHWLIVLGFMIVIPAIYSFRFSEFLNLKATSGSFLGEPVNRYEYLLTQFRVICVYLKLLVLPLGQNLLYEFPASRSFWELKTLLGFLLLFSVFIVGIISRKKNVFIAFGIFWFFIALSVESSILVIRHVIFEHRVYLPSVGFFMVFVMGVYSLVKNKKAFIGVLSILVLTCSYLTYERNKVWQSKVSLWLDVVAKSPRLTKAKLNLGIAYTEEKEYMKAIKVYDTMVEESPNAEGFAARGNVYFDLKEYDMAILDYTKALAVKTNSAQTYSNRGNAYVRKKDYKRALADFNKAIEVNPKYIKSYIYRGNLFRILKKYTLAERDFNEAIKRDPYFAEPYIGIGACAFMLQDYEKAIDYFTHALSIDRNDVSSLINRANSYSVLNQNGKALKDYQLALQIDSRDGQIYYNRGVLFRKIGEEAKASDDFAKAKALGYLVKE